MTCLFTRLATSLDQARRYCPTLQRRRDPDDRDLDELGAGRQSLPELTRAALKPDQAAWLVARAVSLRAF